MNGLALCAGIGGKELGISRALGRGYRTVGWVEHDPFAASVLVARMAEQAVDRAPIWDDLTTFDGRPWRGKVDIVSAGFPCQDLSQANYAGEGLDGKRSGLFFEVVRIIREVEPSLVVLENVPRLVRRGLDRVLAELAELGFDAEWDVFSAAGVGAPHLRRRVFVVAGRVSDPLRGALRHVTERGARAAQAPDGWDSFAPHMGVAMADASCDGHEGHERGPVEAQSHERRTGVVGDADGGRCEVVGLQEFSGLKRPSGEEPDGSGPHWRLPWPPGPEDERGWDEWRAAGGPEPAVRRDADGTASRMDRLRCLGNAVCPQAEERAVVTLLTRLLGE